MKTLFVIFLSFLVFVGCYSFGWHYAAIYAPFMMTVAIMGFSWMCVLSIFLAIVAFRYMA